MTTPLTPEQVGPGAYVEIDGDDTWVAGLFPCTWCGEGHAKREWAEPDGRCYWRDLPRDESEVEPE